METEITARTQPSGTDADPLNLLLAKRADFVAYVTSRTGHRAAAEDIVQEAFLKAMEHLRTLRAKDALLGWFYRILDNALRDQARRGTTASRLIDANADSMEVAAVPAPAASSEACKCVLRAASALKPHYAEALQHLEVEGTPVKVFAARAGLSPSNAAVRVFRARRALKSAVLQACRGCASGSGCAECTCAT